MSFFESLMEGTANAAANSLGNYQKRQQVLEDDERNQQQAIERYRQQQQIQQDMAEQARQAQQARLQEQMTKAEQGGAVLDAQAREKQLTGAGVGDVSTLTPEQEAMIAKGRGLKYGDSLSQLDNQLKSARDNGLFDAAAALSSARKEAVQAIREEADRNFKERKADAADDRNAAMWAAAMKNGDKGAKGNYIHSTFPDNEGNQIGVFNDGSHTILGKSGKSDEAIGRLITQLGKDPRFARLTPAEQRSKAMEILHGTPADAATPKSPKDMVPGGKPSVSNW